MRTVLGGLQQPFEFILIDDGSTDDTQAVVEALGRQYGNVIYIQHFRNQGKSIGLMQGFDAASGDVAITLDADLQDQPEMFPRLLEQIEAGYDFVNGWRRSRHDPAAKKIVSRIYNGLVNRVFGVQLNDINSGLKAYRREVYKSIELRGDLHRLVPVLVALKAFTISEIPVEHSERKHGQSKYRLLRHRGILDVFALIAVNATQTRPFHIFCEAAFVFWMFGLMCFLSWVGLTYAVWGGNSHWRIVGTLLGGVGTWAAFVGSVLPIFGLFLEIEAGRAQDVRWRHRLVRHNKRFSTDPQG
ncbi:hypothetical protein A6A04_04060 [Paramagnetospirillum marisnigri]|uniref:Glycosyltransferase 2-like domain-containing protein n=1 Tax=Paramagnetospirillum marisnigri TaxID=1285242 RepID=A0A178MMI5_9PROT|nr:hypothetical protein A6A04_04060 [Paramagnetospirillum marisnigri]